MTRMRVTGKIRYTNERSEAWKELWRRLLHDVADELKRLDADAAASEDDSHDEGRAAMGPVEQAIRKTFTAPTTLQTLGQGKEFELSAIDTDGIVLLLGAKRWHTRLSWECLESIPGFLSAQAGWVPAGGAHSVAGEPGTLDEHLKRYLKRDVARWLVRVLLDAGVVDVADDTPLRVRVR